MPSAEAVVDRAFIELLGKARRRADDEFRRQVPREATINLSFSGGTTELAIGLAGAVEVPFACIPTWCHIYSGNENLEFEACTATVDVQVTNLQTVGTSVPINGTGAQPILASQSSADISLDGWLASLLAQDIIKFRLASFTGTATWITVSIGIRAIDSDQVVAIVDTAGDTVVDGSGNTVILRG